MTILIGYEKNSCSSNGNSRNSNQEHNTSIEIRVEYNDRRTDKGHSLRICEENIFRKPSLEIEVGK